MDDDFIEGLYFFSLALCFSAIVSYIVSLALYFKHYYIANTIIWMSAGSLFLFAGIIIGVKIMLIERAKRKKTKKKKSLY